MCVMGRRTLKVRLCGAFLSIPLPGTGGVGGPPHYLLSQSEGGARASKGAYTFHRSQMASATYRHAQQLDPLRLAVEAGLLQWLIPSS